MSFVDPNIPLNVVSPLFYFQSSKKAVPNNQFYNIIFHNTKVSRILAILNTFVWWCDLPASAPTAWLYTSMNPEIPASASAGVIHNTILGGTAASGLLIHEYVGERAAGPHSPAGDRAMLLETGRNEYTNWHVGIPPGYAIGVSFESIGPEKSVAARYLWAESPIRS